MAGAGFFGAPRPRLANAFVRPCVNNGERQRCYAWDALASQRVRARPNFEMRFEVPRRAAAKTLRGPGTPFLERIQGKLQERARAIIERRPDLEHYFDD